MSIVFESGHRSSFLADESYPNIDQASEEVQRYDEADSSNDVSDVMHDVSDLGVAVTASYHPPEQSILEESEPSRALSVVELVGNTENFEHIANFENKIDNKSVENENVESKNVGNENVENVENVENENVENENVENENVENVGEVGEVNNVGDVGDVGNVAGVVDDNVEDPHPSGMPGPSDMNSAAAAAVASIAAAEAEVARVAAAAAAAQHHLSATPALKQPTSLTSSSPDSMKEISPPSSSATMAITPQRVKPIPKPDREAQKNGQGLYQCTWPDCSEETTTFSRKCEYNKHMDKHERPYRCVADGCQKLPGFTYSGGLLRHEREVHGKHGGPRNPLHCPHQTCKRHSGKGFSRAENLNEHLRRVHTPGPTPGNAAPIMSSSIMGHVTTSSAANGMVSTATSSASVADALLAHPTSGLLNLSNLSSLTSVLRSLPVLPCSPAASGENGAGGVDDVDDLGHVSGMNGVNGMHGVNGVNGVNGYGNNNNSPAAAAAAVAAAAAAAAAAANAAAFSGVAETGVDNDNANLGMLLNDSPSDPTMPRGRKRSAAAMMAGDDGLNDAALASTQHLTGSDYHELHDDLREEMKRLRQENQEQKKQLDQQKQQTASLIMQISALRQLIAGQHQQ